MTTPQEHPNRVAPWFRTRHPDPEAFEGWLKQNIAVSDRGDFVADRVMARLGADVVIGGGPASGLPAEVLTQRIQGDWDVSLPTESERLLALPPPERAAALDAFVRDRLAVDLGDHVVLQLNRTERNDTGAFYVVTGRILGQKIGDIQLDVDCDPHLTGPTSYGMEPFCRTEIYGLSPGARSYQNPADVLAGKLRGIRYAFASLDKPRYAKHVSDVRLMLKYQTFDPDLAAGSIAELSRATGVPIDRLFPLARLIDATRNYRSRRKRHSPGEQVPMDIMVRDLMDLSEGLAPIIEAAKSGARPRLRRPDIAAMLKNEWLPPGLQPRPTPARTQGATPAESILSPSYLKRGVIPDAAVRQFEASRGAGPQGSYSGSRPSQGSRSK